MRAGSTKRSVRRALYWIRGSSNLIYLRFLVCHSCLTSFHFYDGRSRCLPNPSIQQSTISPKGRSIPTASRITYVSDVSDHCVFCQNRITALQSGDTLNSDPVAIDKPFTLPPHIASLLSICLQDLVYSLISQVVVAEATNANSYIPGHLRRHRCPGRLHLLLRQATRCLHKLLVQEHLPECAVTSGQLVHAIGNSLAAFSTPVHPPCKTRLLSRSLDPHNPLPSTRLRPSSLKLGSPESQEPVLTFSSLRTLAKIYHPQRPTMLSKDTS